MHPVLTHDVWVCGLGVRFRIATDPRTASVLRTTLADLLCPPAASADITFELRTDDDGHTYHLRCQELGIGELGTIYPLLGRLVSNLTAAAVTTFPGLAVHAGVVARNGRAVAFAAPSGVGKSTLTASCLLAGFDYVSDEALCLLPGHGAVAVPLPKPLALTGRSATLLALPRRRWHTQDMVPCSAFSAKPVVQPVVLDHVVVLRRSPGGASLPCPRPAALTVSTLLSMAFNAYRDPEASIEIASSVATTAQCWELDVGDPATAADALMRVADHQPAAV